MRKCWPDAKQNAFFLCAYHGLFVARMEKGNPNDPLLRQVLTAAEEFIAAPGFSADPLEEQHSVVPGLLHKYRNRALLLVKGGCAVNCRYCFRRHFPYADNHGQQTQLARRTGLYRHTYRAG